MRKPFLIAYLISFICIYADLSGQSTATFSGTEQEMHSNQYFVKLCHGVSNQEINALMAELNSVELWKNDQIGLRLWAVKRFPYSCSDGEITDIEEHVVRSKNKTNVDDATLDMIFKLEESGSDDGYSYFDELDLRGTLGANPIRISILDSGISNRAINKNPNYSGPVSYTGYDYIDNDLTPNDLNGHGTHVAAIIYGIVSQLGTPDNVSFDIRKTHDQDGFGNISDLISATIDAVDAGADIINMSFSYYEMVNHQELNPLQLAIDYAEQHGVLVIASAGNKFQDNDHYETVPVPATLPNENIISVASNGPDESLSYFSNYGETSVDVSILGEQIPGPNLLGGQEYVSGTSFSTAIVSALSAILGTRQDQFNGCEIKCILINTSKALPGWLGKTRSGGILDFKKALNNPPANCLETCPAIGPAAAMSCGANCPPETGDMDLCVAPRITVVDKLLVYDVEQDAIAFKQDPVYGPFKGSVIIYPDGTFAYTSANGEADMFVYQVCDNHQEECSDGCNQGVVYINAANCRPPSKSGGYLHAVSSQVSSGNDDAEENVVTGAVYRNSAYLDLTVDPTFIRANQFVGLRFNQIKIPRGVKIESAVIRFFAMANDFGPGNLLFKGQAADSAPGFKSSEKDISSRPGTEASVAWDNVPAWSPGNFYSSPDLSAIVQELIDREGWDSGNSLAILLSGTGKRTAWSYEGNRTLAPELVINYSDQTLEVEEVIEDCVEATGESPKMLTFRYTGQNCSASNHIQDAGKVVCIGDPDFAPIVYVSAIGDKTYFTDLEVPMNKTFSVDANVLGEDKLKTSTTILLKDAEGVLLQTIVINTSGSQPLRVNDQFAGLILEGYLGKNNLTCGEVDLKNREIYDCAKYLGEKPRMLTFRYTGQNCSASDHAQDPGKVICSGDPGLAPVVYITAIGDKDKYYLVNREVSLGDVFSVDAASVGEKELKSTTNIYLKDLHGTVLQTISLHTSGSQPLGVNDHFASLVLEGFIGEKEGHCGDPEILTDGDCCGKTGKKPQILTFQYTGDDCRSTSHSQDPDQVNCSGDPEYAPYVYITVESGDKEHKIFFKNLQIPLNGIFDIDAASIGENKFESSVIIYLKDAQGDVLQEIKFLTNCSEPLGVGNQFGALLLKGYLAENGDLCGDQPISQVCDPTAGCTAVGKRSAIGLIYIGSANTTVDAFANSDGRESLGSYNQIGPGDFMVFSALYRNKNELANFFLRWSGTEEVEIPVETSVDILGNTYGDFKVVQQLDREGNDCRIPYSSCVEVNRQCGDHLTAAVLEVVATPLETIALGGQLSQPFLENNVNLFPNPARDVVFLDLQDFVGRPVKIELYDAVFRIINRIKVGKVADTPLEINVGSLPNGIYSVLIYPGGDQPILKKLVVARD